MWGTNSKSQQFQSNIKIPNEKWKNNNIIHNSSNNYSNNNELNMQYQTPIKQFDNIQNNNNCNTTPFRLDFNYYFGNLWSSDQLTNNPFMQQQLILSPSQLNKDNICFYKKSIEKSYKLTPFTQMKDSNSHNNSISNSTNKIIILNQNSDNISNKKLIEMNNMNSMNNMNNIGNYQSNTSNFCELSKKNLNELFNNAKNENFLKNENKNKLDNINVYKNFNKKNNINNTVIRFSGKNDIKKRNYNLQISRQFVFSSPYNINKPKKIFECSGSTTATTSIKTINKNRRLRKSNEQITVLKKFYTEHKHWSKIQIKEISKKIGLKENKVYKWLWDQRNKEMKSTKFVVKKENNE